MSDTKVSALTAASTPLDEDWLLALAKGTPDDLDRRATLAQVRGEAGFGLRRNAGVWSVYTPFGDPDVAVFFDDFLGSTTSFTAYNTGGGSAFSIFSNSDVGLVGIAQAVTGTTATGRGGFIWPVVNAAANQNIYFGSGRWIFEARIRLPDLSDGTQTFSVRLGFTRDPAISTPADGAFFVYDPATYSDNNWRAVSRNNNSNRAEDTGVAAAANTWQTLRVEVPADASAILSYINGTLVDTNTSNIPSGSTRRTGYGGAILKSAGTTSRLLLLDYVLVKGEFASGRPA